MKKVVKFGGSSLASAEQFKKVGDIIRADEGRRYVVPSAPGKRNSADTKVTDMLYDCYRTAVAGRDFKKKLQNIKARYQEIIDGLNLSLDEIADGSRELRDGVQELQDEANDMIDEYFTFDIDNLTQFLVAGDNPRIDAASGDVIINKYAGMVSGIILMVMFTYVISVFVVHNIEKESSVIGALYALG